MRTISGVVVGMVVFLGLTATMFYLTGHNPKAPASMIFMLAATLTEIIFAVVAGFLAARIADKWIASLALAAVIAALTVYSMLQTPPAGRWLQWATLILISPAFLLGSRFERNH